MAVRVISRPIGHKLNTTQYSGVITNDSGEAIITRYVSAVPTAHGLITGDYVYIESSIESYAGFFQVDVITTNTFKILKEGIRVDYKQFNQLTYYISDLNHGWQSVHLPIVYKLESDLYPINTIEDTYTPRLVSFAADVNGYTGLLGSTNFINVNDLDYIELIGDGNLAGIYQIVTVIDQDEIVINLAWDTSNDFSGYELRKYYNNYYIGINVYAGLQSNHPWYDEKPIELLSTLKFTPESDNKIRFSISEILRGHINNRNNLTLDTLPNNLDFFTEFYITYFEGYDTSDDIEITGYTGPVVDDSEIFIGQAINSMMPFKSLNSGHMSDYINEGDVLARWLTLFDRPVAIAGRFFDLSFLNRFNYNVVITVFKNASGVVTEDITTYTTPGKGLLRIPLDIESGYDEYCVQASTPGGSETENITLPGLEEGENIDLGNPEWQLDDPYEVTLALTAGLVYSDYYAMTYSFIEGYQYDFNFEVTFNFTDASILGGTLIFVALNADNQFIENLHIYNTPSNVTLTTDIIFDFIAPQGMAKLGIMAVATNDSPEPSTGLNVALVTEAYSATETIITDPQNLTEQICISITEECGTTFNDDDLRLTEGGGFRELE